VRLLRGPVTVEDGERIQPVGINEPTCPTSRNSSQTPAHIVAAAQLRLLGDEQAEECASYIAEADDC
jgi:hypothetical protein